MAADRVGPTPRLPSRAILCDLERAMEAGAVSQPLFGRELVLVEIGRFLDRVHAGPSALVVEGEAGIGKTVVWRVGVAVALERGFRVLHAQPAEAERALSLSGLGDLLEPVLDGLEALSLPRRRALEAALLLASDGQARVDARAVALGTLDLVRLQAEERPLLVAVDDLQWLDVPSGELLAFTLRRLTHERVGLLASVRAERGLPTPFELERALGERLARLELGPLSRGALQRLLRARLAAPMPRPVLSQIYDRSGGNPLYALALARAAAEGGSDRLPAGLRALVADRIEQLPEQTRVLLVALAAAAQPTIELVRELGGEEALQPAEEQGIVVVEGSRIRFSHPLLAAAAHGAATSRARRAAHRRLAELADEPEQRARHLALAAEGPDEAVAAALDAAAATALARGAPGAAVELAEQALVLTPPGDEPALNRRRLEAARRHLTLGNTTRQRELLEQLLAAATTELERAEPLWQLATLTWQEGGLAEARTMVEEALRCAAGDDALSAAILLATWWVDHHWFGTLGRARRAHAHAERARDRRLRAITLGWIGTTTFSSGLGFRRELFEQAVALERDTGFIEARFSPTTQYGWTAVWAGDIPLARELLERSLARASATDDESCAAVLYYLAWLQLIAGEWEDALERADESRKIATDAGYRNDAAVSLVVRAVIEAHQGRLVEARANLDQTRALLDSAMGALLWTYGDALVALASGDPATAGDALRPTIAEMRSCGIEEPGLYMWLPSYLNALTALGRLDEAAEVVSWFEQRAVRLQRRWALAICAHARGMIAAAGGDTAAALAALELAGVARADAERVLALAGREHERRRARGRSQEQRAEEERDGKPGAAHRTRPTTTRLNESGTKNRWATRWTSRAVTRPTPAL
jgi:tetratricopeptide (TPR) repeat protein